MQETNFKLEVVLQAKNLPVLTYFCFLKSDLNKDLRKQKYLLRVIEGGIKKASLSQIRLEFQS